MMEQREADLSREDEDQVRRDISVVLVRHRRHWQTASDIRGHMPHIPEPVIARILDQMVADGQARVNRGTSRTSYQRAS